jgi:hypothetical protein
VLVAKMTGRRRMRTGVPSDERLIARAGSLAASTVLGRENSYLNVQIIANERLSLLALPLSRFGSNIENGTRSQKPLRLT